MSFQRVGLRVVQQQIRSPMFRPMFRSTLRRSFASAAHPKLTPEAESKLVGAVDNAFTRERAAVKAHAAATSGMLILRILNGPWQLTVQISGANSPSSKADLLSFRSQHLTDTALSSLA